MRLIDADALKKEIQKGTRYFVRVWDPKGRDKWEFEKDLSQKEIDEIIDNAPTIDAEPVRHGKLMRTEAYPHRLYCSECFKTLIRNEEICFEKNEFPKYCMWCGARMEGVEE